MILPSEIRFADDNVKKAFYELEKGDNLEKELFRFISQAMDNIEENAFCGVQIPKKQIPKEYMQRYLVGNLWKYDLTNAWRLIYSISGGKAVVVSIVLEWMSHKDYERRFNY